MRYKVGDKVRIKSLEVLQCHPKLNKNGLMNRYCGQIAEVEDIVTEGIYRLDIDQGYGGGCWCWHEDMLEDVETNNQKFALVKKETMKKIDSFMSYDFFVPWATTVDNSLWGMPQSLKRYNKLIHDTICVPKIVCISEPQHSINLIGEHKFLTLNIR